MTNQKRDYRIENEKKCLEGYSTSPVSAVVRFAVELCYRQMGTFTRTYNTLAH